MNAGPDRTRKLIVDALIETMPETAAASGFCSLVDLRPWLAEMDRRFPLGDARPSNLGLTGLLGWLAANDIEAGPRAARALRENWIHDELRAAANEYAQRLADETARRFAEAAGDFGLLDSPTPPTGGTR